MSLPLVAITTGDPTGIGPEIVAAAWAEPRIHELARLVAVGHPELLRRAVRLRGLPIDVVAIDDPDDARSAPRQMPCLAACRDDALAAEPGQIDPRGGQAAYDALRAAVELALAGRVDAITTGPLHKVALWQAGHHVPGHTELLAQFCGLAEAAMMLSVRRAAIDFGAKDFGAKALDVQDVGAQDSSTTVRPFLAVVHVTLHMPLREIFDQLTAPAIVEKCRLVDDVLRQLNAAAPRIAVAALNPHAGESGLFGDEEPTIIAPAVRQAQALGLDAQGPIAADTLMMRLWQGEFDAAVAMYHDQGHIAVKLAAMHEAVNVTLGLPIVRTSVAHGTAFDLAWTGRAEHRGMIEAIDVAARLAAARGRGHRFSPTGEAAAAGRPAAQT